MTFIDRIDSAQRFLTEREKQSLMPSEAELIAGARLNNALKASGCMYPQSYRFLLQEQVNRGGQ